MPDVISDAVVSTVDAPLPAPAPAEPAEPSPNEKAANQPVRKQRTRNKAIPSDEVREGAGAKPGRLSAPDAAARVLQENGVAVSCPEMIATEAAKGYGTSPGGKTPLPPRIPQFSRSCVSRAPTPASSRRGVANSPAPRSYRARQCCRPGSPVRGLLPLRVQGRTLALRRASSRPRRTVRRFPEPGTPLSGAIAPDPRTRSARAARSRTLGRPRGILVESP